MEGNLHVQWLGNSSEHRVFTLAGARSLGWDWSSKVWAGEVARALSATPGGLASFFQ